MADKVELHDEELETVNGGEITYTWDESKGIGSLGINGTGMYVLLDKNAFGEYYSQVKGTLRESKIIKNLLAMGIIKLP